MSVDENACHHVTSANGEWSTDVMFGSAELSSLPNC